MKNETIEIGKYFETLRRVENGQVSTSNKEVVCQRHKLGWATIGRESKVEWNGLSPTLRCRDRNATAYCLVCGESDVVNKFVNDIISCLGAGLAAAGIAAIIISPAAATPAFAAAFKACLVTKIGDIANSLTVNLEVTTETTDWGPC